MSPKLEHEVDLSILRRALCRLAEVDELRDLGARGPLMASAGKESLFHCLFGRDAIRMAMDLLEDFPTVARATLLALASLQGVRKNPRSEEEPGRMLHEHRQPDDPHAIRLSKYWDWPYYGAVDTTPQWINLAAAYCSLHGTQILEETVEDRLGRQITLRVSLSMAIDWLVGRLDDPAGGGYLWVLRGAPSGSRNQVWEDSSDAFYHSDGTPFDPAIPFAPVGVQGYAYDAMLSAADLLDQTSGPIAFPTNEIRWRANRLRELVLSNFWLPELETFAHAVTIEPDGLLRPACVVASSPGHLLASRLLDGAEVASIRQKLILRLVQPDLLAGAGIRTKSTNAPYFRPGSYHNGSTWPMDTGVIADGLRRHGRAAEADDLETRIVRACGIVGTFPEFFRGEIDGSISINREQITYMRDGDLHFREQRPQENQGWTVTRVWRILRRLGIPFLNCDKA
jgi:glycogen debranching enzyme